MLFAAQRTWASALRCEGKAPRSTERTDNFGFGETFREALESAAMRGGLPCTRRTPPSFVGHVVPDVPERRRLQGVPKPHGGCPIPPAGGVPAAQPAFHLIPRF